MNGRPYCQRVMMLVSFVCGLFLIINEIKACDQKFEGFGVFLGSNKHFGGSRHGTEEKVLDIVYNFLGIRLFRTSYEENFSPEPDKYEIKCTQNDKFTCAWIKVHRYISTLPDVKVFASIWSPPHYMKDSFYHLLPENETAYYYFIKNITHIMQQDYNITIENVSPVNEPENVFAPWDHTNMSPDQLCRLIKTYNDPLISVCPENSYFWVSKIYYNFESDDPALNCSAYCSIKATHAYSLNLNNFLAYYDLKAQNVRGTENPIWMTEVSSTYRNANTNQMQEALDLATNILNFVGATCVQRYYFWYAYTIGYSGESLIWGDDDGTLYFPKKFFVYKLFVNASATISGPVEVNLCNVDHNQLLAYRIVENLGCIQFGDENRVLVNKEANTKQLVNHDCKSLCCTTEQDDFICSEETSIMPAKSICHCILKTPSILNNSIIL